MRNNITVKGRWMYPPSANTLMTNLVKAGLLDISTAEISALPLEQANEAVTAAAAADGKAKCVMIAP